MVHRAIEVADELSKNSIKAKVIDVYRLKPLNSNAISEEIREAKKVITLEEHTINGGIGSMIAELLVDFEHRVPLKRIAIEDKFLYTYGVRENLHRKCALDRESVVKLTKEWLA